MSTSIRQTHKQSQTFNTKTATEAFKLISGIRRHIEDDHCCCCKAALLNSISVENNMAGPLGGKTSEPAADRIVEVHSTHGIKEHSKI
jgi:hypothetical protein